MVDNKKYEKGTLGWFREQQKIKANKDGFDNIDDWSKWKIDPFNILEKKYGEEFADWARQNKNKLPNKWLNAGCKTRKEYKNKCAQDAGFSDYAERMREYTYKTGKNLPREVNDDCSLWFGEFISQNYVMKTFEDSIKIPSNNPGFDWICKKGQKIDHKGACLKYYPWQSPHWSFHIRHNKISDYFILSAWDDKDNLNPLHVWMFHKNDKVRGRKFCEFEEFVVTNTPEKLKELEKWEVTDRLGKLKEFCNGSRY